MIGVDSDTIIGGDESRQHGGKFKVSALRGVNIDSGLKSIILTAETEIALETGSFGSMVVTDKVQGNLTIDGILFATRKSFLINKFKYFKVKS